jgi:hypothetical protein
LERSLHGLVLFEGVEVLEEEQPRGLLGVVELAGGASVLVQDIIDVFERLLEQRCPCLSFVARPWRRGVGRCRVQDTRGALVSWAPPYANIVATAT